ncbi:tetratricopeptide repeat protein [Prevotella sp. ne3005]|uniref:type IX secretion system periplasmic lipoprotein PorW/SprE n=1 Tax=Prevotella sp. ne3005 TaxID=1761887 RepID=UPI000B856E45|nr:tetratricopeptide repeat protein [Prevotella sp. ne3005]
MVSCSTQKNTAQSRWWHSFNARYNTYFNGSQAFIEGNLEKEKGNKDNYTELIPLYTVGNKQSRDIGKGQFDRTIEKCEKAIHQHSIKAKPEWNSSKRKTAKDREWLGRREYNPFLWKAWLLLGKAQFQKGAFDEAAATFSYMSRLYHTQPLMNGLARAWLAKCYTELGWKYDAEDVIRNMSRDSMDFRAVKDWDYTYANYYIRLGDYQKAIPYLRKVIKHERRSIQRAREWFLMGQIQNLVGNREEAYRAFGKVIGCHPPYELEFNARIAQTEVAASSDSRQMISKLRRMAASDNNAEYLDQVYYAIGNIHMTRRDTTEAIRAYEKGNRLSTRNGIEKGVLLLTLGNIYWEKEQFADAQRCYGEAIGLLDKERPDYEALSNRSKILDELVPYTNTIHLQDSLLALATMPEAERNKAIDRVIDALKKKEKEERDAQLEQEAAAAANASQAARADNNRAVTPTMPSAGNGQWYFYNPTAVSQGKATFQRQWGKRENIDNWQRINQTVISLKGDTPEDQQDQEDPETAMDQERPLSPADSIAADPHERDYYLAQIPFTAEQQAECHTLLQEALFRAGIILKDKMDHLRLSEQYLRRLTSDYPGYEHADEAWYHLYLLYLRQGNHLQANNCISHLKAEHPESEWTILLTDPYYAENAKFGEHIEDSLYSATYEAFKQDRTDMVKANASLSAKRFPQGANRAKFLFIDGMSRLNDGDGDGCLELLREVVEKYPDSEVSPLAGMIIKGVQDGRRLHGGKFDIGDVWTMRDITLTHDSTVVDTLSTERNQQYLFLLVYEPDSVNENQLLFEMARYNFTNFLVRNFEIQIDEDNGLHRMIISGFLSFDEAMQYARQLYGNNQMKEKLASCRSLIISEANLQLIGRQFSYDEYQQFYEQEFAPMRISKEQLLLIPEDMEQPDIEDTLENPATPENPEETIPPAQQPRQKQPVKDFDFGDDFW